MPGAFPPCCWVAGTPLAGAAALAGGAALVDEEFSAPIQDEGRNVLQATHWVEADRVGWEERAGAALEDERDRD